MKKTGKRIIGIVVLLLIVVLLQGRMVSTYSANSAATTFMYQPKKPEGLEKFSKLGK